MSPYDDNWNGEPPERARVVRRALGWTPKLILTHVAGQLGHIPNGRKLLNHEKSG